MIPLIKKSKNNSQVILPLVVSEWNYIKYQILEKLIEKVPVAAQLYPKFGKLYKRKITLTICEYACFEILMSNFEHVKITKNNADIENISQTLFFEEKPQTYLINNG